MKTTCFCSTHLTNKDYDDLRNKKAVFCPICHKMLWLENGKLYERKAHLIRKGKNEQSL